MILVPSTPQRQFSWYVQPLRGSPVTCSKYSPAPVYTRNLWSDSVRPVISPITTFSGFTSSSSFSTWVSISTPLIQNSSATMAVFATTDTPFPSGLVPLRRYRNQVAPYLLVWQWDFGILICRKSGSFSLSDSHSHYQDWLQHRIWIFFNTRLFIYRLVWVSTHPQNFA